MNHFQPKSLAFYGGAIAFVVGLFGVVTSYGEANLKTAQSIGGEYRLNLPVSELCGGGKPVFLSIQQSGVYVAAALTNPALARSPSISKSMTLSGQWQNQRLSLAGQVPVGVLCDNSKEATPAITVKIEGAISPNQPSTQSTTLTGTLSLDAATAPLIAQRQPVSQEEVK
jgi:hypothetical protein